MAPDLDTKPLTTHIYPASDSGAIAAAAQILRQGGLAAFPTETVYGLGADATSDTAVAKIFQAKRRPQFNPLISHVASLSQARAHGDFDATALRLAEAFWPGPLTLVVPVSQSCGISLLARAGLDTVALRVPNHPVAQQLLQAFGRPVAAPSANLSGSVSPTTAAHVLAGLGGRIDFILDGGACDVGVESTIIACGGGDVQLLRPGGLAREKITAVLQEAGLSLSQPVDKRDPGVIAPGMLASHYAPQAKVRLDVEHVLPGEAVLDFAGALKGFAATAPAYGDLSPQGDVIEAAAQLFALLRKLDSSDGRAIAVAAVPEHDLGEAINDRLRRAAADR